MSAELIALLQLFLVLNKERLSIKAWKTVTKLSSRALVGCSQHTTYIQRKHNFHVVLSLYVC
jgi:hypothetical protein